MKKTIKRALSVMLVVVIMLTAAPLSGFVGLELPEWLDFSIVSNAAEASGTCGENLTWTFDEFTGTLTISGAGAMTDFSYSNRPWYDYRELIRKVIINSGVTSIGSYSFSNCFSLVSASVSNTVTSINNNAFSGCHILESIVIPKNVVSIGKFAFDSCYELTDIYFSGTFLEFMKMANMIKTPNIHCVDGVFKGAKGFCGENIVYAEDSETKTLKITGYGSIYDINSSTLKFWSTPENVENIIILEGVTRIGDFSFEKFTALKHIEIPNSVTSIGNMAFYQCDSLEEIVIPDTVTSIGGGLFTSCDNLKKVILPKGTTELDSAYVYVLPFEYGFFHYCSNLKNFIIPDTVESIGTDAFNLSGITSIKIPESVTAIGKRAFMMSRALESIEIPDSVTTLGEEAFSNCTSLETATIGNGITIINTKTFEYCSSLTTVTLPNTLTHINQDAFASCDNISDVYYAGSEEEWKKIVISSGNNAIKNAAVHYNYCEHSYGDWTIETDATCTENGIEKRICSKCKKEEEKEILLYGHNFDYSMSEENLTRPTESSDGYYTFTCKNGCGATETEIVKLADYSVYNEAEATIKGYLNNPNITDAAKQEIMDAIMQNAQNSDYFDENGNIRKDLIESEQHIVDTATSSAQELLDFIETKISNGEYTKPDYSEIDEKINEIDEILKDTTISDEMKSELDDIKSELKELKNDEDASQSDVDGTLDSLMDRLDEIASTIANCANGNHSFTKYVITKDAECDVYGIKTAICDNGCGATDEEVILAFGHSYVENVIAPTCTEDGYTEYNCSTCGDSYNDNVITATGHSYTSEVTKVPTHTETGVRTYTCNCGHSYTETIEATSDHTYVESITKEATCTSVGEITFVCICGSSYTEEISVLGHDYATDYTVDTEATCTTDGSKSQHCSRCDSTTNVTTIPAKGHNYSEWTLANEGTCTNPGQDMRSCLFCGDVQYRENSSKEHDYVSELIIVVEPTCTEQGYSTYVCAACDYRYVDDYTAPYGHNYIDGVCERCGEKDPSVPDEPEYNYTFKIQKPSMTTIRHKDGIKLHVNIEGNVPAGSYVVWTANNNKFKTEEINNGNSLKIISDSNGTTTFTATLYSADGEIIVTDTVEMKSKAGFFDKIGSFFRSLFGGTKIHEN